MTVLLVNPSWEGLVSKKARLYNWSFPPLDLLNLSAILKEKGIQARMLDLRVRPLPAGRLAEEFQKAEKIIITSSPLDRWQCPNIELDIFFQLCGLINDKKKLIVTGVHGTIHPEYVLKKTRACLLVRGEPEKTISEIFDRNDWTGINGISYWRDNKLISNPDQEPVDLNDIPVPDYNAVNIDDYRYEFLGTRYAMLQFSRGCPYDCIFCLKDMYGRGIRRKNQQKCIEEIDYVVNEIGARSIYFYDLTFTAHKPTVHAVCEHIIKKGYKIKWCCQTRVEMIDSDLLSVMKRAGCELIHFGVESGSTTIAKILEKRVDLEQIRRGVSAARKAGITVACFFMFGFPGETVADMNRTIDFALKIDPDYASFHIAIPYPGTRFYEMTGEKKLFPEMYTGDVSAAELKKILRKAFVRFYFRPVYIARTLFLHPQNLLSKIRLFYNFIK